MTGEFVTNPAVIGLASGAIIVLAIQTLWTKVMGAPTELTIPSRLTSIDARLVEINLKLELLIQDHKHTAEKVKENEKDFWDHMKIYHGQFRQSPTDSGAVRARE